MTGTPAWLWISAQIAVAAAIGAALAWTGARWWLALLACAALDALALHLTYGAEYWRSVLREPGVALDGALHLILFLTVTIPLPLLGAFAATRRALGRRRSRAV